MEVGIVVQPLVTTAITVGLQGPQGPQGLTGGVGNFSWNEQPAGTIDGANRVFATAHTPIQILLALNGLIQNPGFGNDYSMAGNTITFSAANTPHVGDTILATYIY